MFILRYKPIKLIDMSYTKDFIDKQRLQLRSNDLAPYISYAILKCVGEAIEVEDLTDQQVINVNYEATDSASEAYSASMREGHGIGCYCSHCCR